MSEPPSSLATARQVQLLALADELRPELHRYCARLMGSVIDGEDVVQDTFTRAYVAVDELKDDPPLRAWLFRIAHNRALDLLRSRAIRAVEPIEAAHEVADPESPDPVEVMMRREAVETAVSRFAELPTMQRSVVILKDVLDQSLEEIAAKEGTSLARFLTNLHDEVLSHHGEASNFASLLRCCCLIYTSSLAGAATPHYEGINRPLETAE